MTTRFQEGIITFDAASKRDILSYFGKTVDEDGFIVEAGDPKQRVLTPEGDEIKENEFAGIRKGSEIYIKSDLPSLIELIDKLR